MLAAAWAGLLLWLGTRPGAGLPAALPGADKIAHVACYGVLGFLLARAIGTRAAWVWAGLAGVAWGALDEWLQASVPGRSSDLLDVLADAIGAFAGGWIALRTAARALR